MKTKFFFIAFVSLLICGISPVNALSLEQTNTSTLMTQLSGYWFYRSNGTTHYEQISNDNIIINNVEVTIEFGNIPQILSYKLKTYGATVTNFAPEYGRLQFIADSNPSDVITFEFTYTDSGQTKTVEYNFWIDPASMGNN